MLCLYAAQHNAVRWQVTLVVVFGIVAVAIIAQKRHIYSNVKTETKENSCIRNKVFLFLFRKLLLRCECFGYCVHEFNFVDSHLSESWVCVCVFRRAWAIDSASQRNSPIDQIDWEAKNAYDFLTAGYPMEKAVEDEIDIKLRPREKKNASQTGCVFLH